MKTMKTKHWLHLLWLLLLWLHPSTKRNGAHLECFFHAQSYVPQSSTLFTKLPRKCGWTIGSKTHTKWSNEVTSTPKGVHQRCNFECLRHQRDVRCFRSSMKTPFLIFPPTPPPHSSPAPVRRPLVQTSQNCAQIHQQITQELPLFWKITQKAQAVSPAALHSWSSIFFSSSSSSTPLPTWILRFLSMSVSQWFSIPLNYMLNRLSNPAEHQSQSRWMPHEFHWPQRHVRVLRLLFGCSEGRI